MKLDVERAQFVNADILHVVPEITAATIQTWVNRGLFSPALDRSPGTGQRRLYSGLEVCGLAMMHALTSLGFPPKEASGVVQQIMTNEHDLLARGNPAGRASARAIITANPEGQQMKLDNGEIVAAPRFHVTFLVKADMPKGLPSTCLYFAYGELMSEILDKLAVIARD